MAPNDIAEEPVAIAAKAESAAASGDWAAAADAYEALVRSEPKQIDWKYRLAQAYEELGRFDDAIAVLTDPSIADRDKSKRRLAKTYIEAKHFDSAMPLVEELIALFPGNSKYEGWKSLCDISRRIQQGEALVAANSLDEAETLYLDLLAQYPETARAYLHLGQIYAEQKRWGDAIPPLRAGLKVEPDSLKLRTALARALFKNGEPAEAISLLQADGCRDDVDSLFLLQRCHAELHDWRQVDEVTSRLLALVPAADPLRAIVAKARQDALIQEESASIDAIASSGDFDRALAGYRKLVARHADSSLAWLKLGTALADAERGQEAVAAFREAQDRHPDDLEIRAALTRAVFKSSDDEEILRHAQDAAASGRADFESLRWLARYRADREEWAASEESAAAALALDPESASARVLLVRALMELDRLPEALAEVDTLLAGEEKRVEALQLKGDTLIRLARVEDAIGLYREALEESPKHPLISHRLSGALLLNGDIEGFHLLHEKRRVLASFIADNGERPFEEWNGELSIEGKLLVWPEAGLTAGETILHLAFVRPLVALGIDVVLQVEPRFVASCRRSFPDATIVPTDSELPGITHHSPLASLSRWFRPDLASFGSQRPYLVPNREAVAQQRNRLQKAAGEGQLLVGVSLGGESSVGLDQLLGAIDLPGVTLVDVQGDGSDTRLLKGGAGEMDDIDSLATLIAAMDLVVSDGNTPAHVAGALGLPNFLLLPSAPSPYWLAKGERCIWYPGTRLFRQAPIDAGGEPVLSRLGKALQDFASDYDNGRWLADTLVHEAAPARQAASLSPGEICDAIGAFIIQAPYAQSAYRSALELIGRLPIEHFSRKVQIQRAELLSRFGRWEEARTVYAALRPAEGTDPEIERHILATSLAMYDLNSALAVARGLAEGDAACRLTAAAVLRHLYRDEEALAELRAASLHLPELEGLGTLIGTLLLESGEFERAESYLAAEAGVTGRNGDDILLGRAVAAQGRDEDALAIFDKALTGSQDDPAANFWRTQQRIDMGLAPLVPLGPMQGGLPAAGRDDVVIFFVADSSFFWQHGLVLLASIGRRSPNAKCHVHVINPDSAIASAVDVVRSLLPDLEISYSFERAHLQGCSDDHRRTYYASVRFVRLAEVFAQSPASYLCLDADCIVRGDVAASLSTLGVGDIGIRMRFDERPHMMVAAGALLLHPTKGAAKFIESVSMWIRRTLEASEAVWFLDQIVLSDVVRQLGRREIKVAQLDMTFIDWFFQDDSLVWTGKGPRKLSDKRYTDELSQYRFLEENVKRLMPRTGDEHVDLGCEDDAM